MAYVASRYFGLRRFGVIYGMLFGAYSIAVGIGPSIGAYMREAYGSYDIALWAVIAALTVSSAVMMTLGRYRY